MALLTLSERRREAAVGDVGVVRLVPWLVERIAMSDDTALDVCSCGHIRDEHDYAFFADCNVEGCDCGDFELAEEYVEEGSP